MEFEFDIHRLLGSDRVVSVWDSTSLAERRNNPSWVAQMAKVIDTMGRLSAQAQGLPSPITTRAKMLGTDQRLYMYADQNKAIGILKVGTKKLFIRNAAGAYKEIEPLCVLDFYVHESHQRNGIGLILFEVMLASEKVPPHKFGYDRPSPKLLGFLNKHFGLSSFLPQANSFVVFNAYFDPSFISPNLTHKDQAQRGSCGSQRATRTSGSFSTPWATDEVAPVGKRPGPL
eukprot:EG_transcript_25250